MTSPQTHIPARSRVSLFVLAALTTIVLAGCSGAGATAPPAASPVIEVTPMFTSDEEALAAAELAYRNYMAITDQIARDGGSTPERIEGLVTVGFYPQTAEEFSYFSDNGFHASGATNIDSFKIQSLEVIESKQHIRAYVCLDVTDNRLLDTSGADVTPIDRPSRVPLEILLIVEPKNENPILLSSSDVWSGTNFC